MQKVEKEKAHTRRGREEEGKKRSGTIVFPDGLVPHLVTEGACSTLWSNADAAGRKTDGPNLRAEKYYSTLFQKERD